MSNNQLIANRFEIQDLLGHGGMGAVYRGADTQTGETVAVKALNPDVLERDPSLLERFVREGEALCQLNHPNIVHMISAVEEEGKHYLVMEFVEGGSLRDLLTTRGNLPANEVVKIALEVSDALTRAHHLGIIHRDLKPANVLLAKDGTPRLADFGIAHIQESSHLTQTGVLIGTVDYLSPEVCQGDPPDELSDIWAFGVMLFEMLSGKLPFEGKSMTAKITAILHQPVPDLKQLRPEIPDALVGLIYRMMEKIPQLRIPSVRLLGAELEEILKGRESVTFTYASSTSTKPASCNNLPAQTTSFIGREKEIAEIKKDISEHRLITLTGPGGTGKTRLSLQVAANLLDQFSGGVWFVELAPITNPELIPQTILSAANMQTQQGRSVLDSLLDFLREKTSLLVLDNCEHLIEACAKLADTLLTAAPNMKILASSREALGVKGEMVWRVPSLLVPDLKHLPSIEQFSQYEAVRLFIERARLVQQNFAVTKDNAPAVAQICSRLDGIPLAIELAAARLKILSTEQIAERLDDCFRLLTSGSRTALPRQQTLRATIDWSYNLLSGPEMFLFRRLAVFISGWTLEAAEEVCSGDGVETEQILDLMLQLVNKSLVAVEMTQAETRYRILETVRQYAREKLFDTNEASPIRNKHLDYFVNLAEQAELELSHSNQVSWLNRLDDELDNFRLALEWSLMTNNSENALRIVGALGQFWRTHNNYLEEGRKWVKRVTETGSQSNAQSKALYWGSILARTQEDFLIARKLSNESLELCRILDDKQGIARVLGVIGGIDYFENEFSAAQNNWDEALLIYRQLKDKQGIANILNNLGQMYHIQGDVKKAQDIYEECLTIGRELENKWYTSFIIGNLGDAVFAQGNLARARELYEEALMIYGEMDDKNSIAVGLSSLANLLCQEGYYNRSAQVQGATVSILKELGTFLEPIEQANFEKTASTLKERMGAQQYEKEFEMGKVLSLEHAIELAMQNK